MKTIKEQSVERHEVSIADRLKAGPAQCLAQTLLAQNSVQRFAEYVAFERELLGQERHPQDQAHLEEFCRVMRNLHANSLLRLVKAEINASGLEAIWREQAGDEGQK